MKQKIFALLVLLLFSQLGYAKTPGWLHQMIKVDNPNQLAYLIWVIDSEKCFITEKAVQKIVERVFIRSRIKPLEESSFNPSKIYLDIELWCHRGEPSQDWNAFSLSIYFARKQDHTLINFNFGTVGIGNKTFIPNTIKEHVEDAITAYIKTNFDL